MKFSEVIIYILLDIMTRADFAKQQILSPTDIVIAKDYTFTVNPSDKHQFFGNLDRIKEATKHINVFLRCYPKVRIYLALDMSRTGRIHWHGTIMFPTTESIRMFYEQYVHSMLETHQIEMDTIADTDKWNEYIHKVENLWDVEVRTETSCKKLAQLHPELTTKCLHKNVDDYF